MSVLVVASRSPSAIETTLEGVESRHLPPGSVTNSEIADAAPVVVVLDHSSPGGELATLFETVRSSGDLTPVVVVADEEASVPSLRAIDRLVVRPYEPATLREAVEETMLVSEYDRAVGKLFDRAVEEASGADRSGPIPRDVQRLRREADGLVDDLVAIDDPDLLAALLENPADLARAEE